jgi:transcriptional regulator with XRE-family HTH domain
MVAVQPGRNLSERPARTQPDSGPTVLRIVVGNGLRRLRQAAGITREAAGEAIRASNAKISRLELGRVGFKQRDVADLLTLYGVTDEQDREALLALARQANEPGWWHKYGDILPSWFEMYIGLEQSASVIRTYEIQFVPGLLQTEDYARAVAVLGYPGESEDEIERRVRLRMARQRFLTQSQVSHLWAVVDEVALRRAPAGPQLMRAQLQHLIELTELPNITLQVLPFRSSAHVAAGGPYTLLRFREPDLPDIVYLEQLTGALYLDKRQDVDHYLLVMDRLLVEARSPTDTVKFLNKIIKAI